MGGEKKIVEVTTDEAIGVAIALGQQVHVDRDIWEGARVSGMQTAIYMRVPFYGGSHVMSKSLAFSSDKIFTPRTTEVF